MVDITENGSEAYRANPVDNSALQHSSKDLAEQHPQKEILPGDSATTQAEKLERHGTNGTNGIQHDTDYEQSQSKRRKLDQTSESEDSRPYMKGIAPIKAEFLIPHSSLVQHVDADDAEAARPAKDEKSAGRGGKKTKGGQNTGRTFGSSRDQIELCKSRDQAGEFDPITCKFGDKCRLEHDIRKYLKEGKREDLLTFNGQCPVEEINGFCSAGWRCRFAGSHSKNIKHEDGREELVQFHSKEKPVADDDALHSVGVVNIVGYTEKIELRKKKFSLPQSDKYLAWLSSLPRDDDQSSGKESAWTEPPLRASEKRKIYYGPETPILAPLTTQGNLPFRRLCVQLGAQVTWSEMAMGLPLIQGEKGEWALLKAHESEITPPNYTPKGIVTGYNNSQDLKFGAQIAANKPWVALKTTEVLTKLCPNLRAIDLNCGCPIDLVFRQGAGSALLDTPGRLEKILRGMNLVSGEVPITVKIRMGTKDKQPTAEKLCQRLVLGGQEAQEQKEGPAGVAAITLHGRSRQQRYTRSADWTYIAECASLVKKLRSERDNVTDTVRAADDQGLSASAINGMPYFIGNGDVLSHVDYNQHIEESGVDSVMIGRGALVKPWVFEEITAGQYLDKTSSERLRYVEQFCKNGLEYWGSDEIGVGTTRRFLLEWLSFACRYIPVGLLEYLPPRLGDRPPAFRGRDDMETLLSSANYKDWIKISEMYLGKAHANFHFEPKHKSNSYEIEAEG